MGKAGVTAAAAAVALLTSCTQQAGYMAPAAMPDTIVVATTATADPAPGPPAPAVRLAAMKDVAGVDTFEVWICDVPTDTTDPTFGDPGLRLPLTAIDVVHRAGSRLHQFFSTISHGTYRPRFVAGGTITMATTDTSQDCVDDALTQSSPAADAVLAVANAEHTAEAPGGWGTPGSWLSCTASCAAARTRRAAYVGASDFHLDWGPVPALDLLEHEIGHTMGLPHSGEVLQGEFGYTSALDLMSNSAAPRDVDPTRRDAPDTLAVNRLALGWLLLDDIVSAAEEDGHTTTARLTPSTSSTGIRALLLPVDARRMLSVEYLTATGFDGALPRAGVAVHLIDDTEVAAVDRVQETLVGAAPYTDLLGEGDLFVSNGWSLRITSVDPFAAQVAVTPDHG